MAKKKDIDINIDSTEVKTKKSNLYDDIKDFLSEKDVTDFVVMAIKDSDESDGISLMTNRDKQFSPATIIGLAHVMASLIANKVGFVSQIKTDGNDMEQRLVKTFAQIVNEFSCEFLSAVVSDLADDADLKIRLLKAMAKSDPELQLLHLHSQMEAKERTEMYCNGDCCDDCLEKACSKLAKAMAKLEFDDDDDDDDDDDSDDKDTILEKFIKNI